MGLRRSALLLLFLLLGGFGNRAEAQALRFDAVDLGTGHAARVDAFVVIVDASQSMHASTFGRRKVDVATEIAAAILRSAPELDYSAGVRTFGQGNCLPDEPTSLLYGMRKFSRSGTLAALARVRCAAGRSPLDQALDAAALDLGGAPGRSAVLILSDGLNMGGDEIGAAERLHAATGACVYAIHIGRHPDGELQLRRVVEAADCGGFVRAETLTDASHLRALVVGALLAGDADADGVGDASDRCPDTQPGTVVDAAGCPLDTDRDGVPNTADRCPDTAPHTPVDADGCPVLEAAGGGVWRVPGEVLFTTGSADLRPEALRILDIVARYLRDNTAHRLAVEGHTDDVGTDENNQRLSERRAEATRAYLVQQGVAAGRFETRGYGEAQPLVPNDSSANRARNRRIEFRVLD